MKVIQYEKRLRQEKMKINFEQSGGLAGINISSSVDTNCLSNAEKENLENTIRTTNFFNLPSNNPTPKGSADYYVYKITVEEAEQNNYNSANKSHTVEFTDLSMIPELKPLIKIMREKAIQ
jgi:hypothetical protein